VISYRFEGGSTPAILLSLARLVFRATVTATRLTSRVLMQTAVFCIGFYIGYTAVTRDRPRA
jgi:hypothetical protein